MEKVYEELDYLKVENEKLKVENAYKTGALENLNRALNEQLKELREAVSKLEKQGVELEEKTAEISSLRQMQDDLKSNLNEKEFTLKCISAANGKLKLEWQEKLQNCEEEKRSLMSALDEANENNIDQEQKINVYRAELEGLKGLLSASQNKCMEAERNAKTLKELRERDGILIGLEEDIRNVKDQLKWKKEQFKHLEEAHDKLKSEFKAGKKAWEQERSNLFDEISSLQTSLDSKSRIAEDLQKRLEMCSHALSSEETRRKFLEFQVSEYKSRYEDVYTEFHDAKSQLERLTAHRGEEIADLKHALGTKDAYYNEVEYQKMKLEQENQELLASLKELREATIQRSGDTSTLAKVKRKLKSVEQIHRSCSTNLRAKEAEWNSQLETVTQELYNCRSALEGKEATLRELEWELESCNLSALQVQLHYEELVVESLVLRSTISEARTILVDYKSQINQSDKETDEKLLLLMKQLELKNAALTQAQDDFEKERVKASSLLSRLEYLECVEHQQLQTQKQMERYQEMLEEASRRQLELKEKSLHVQSESDERVRQLCDALDMANSELALEREKVASLLIQVESLDLVKEKHYLMQMELEKSKEMLEECYKREILLEDKVTHMRDDSETKVRELRDALDLTKAKLVAEQDKTESLERKIECVDQMERESLSTMKELQKHQEMLEEACRYQNFLKEKVLQMEIESEKKQLEGSKALDKLESELSEKISEVHRLEFEAWLWKSMAESLKLDFERSQTLRKELEASLLAQVEAGEATEQEKKNLVSDLEEKNDELEIFRRKIASLEEENAKSGIEKGEMVEHLKEEVGLLEHESVKNELETAVFEHMTAQWMLRNEKERSVRIMEQKDQKIEELLQHVNFAKTNSANSSLSSQLAEKQTEISLIKEAWVRLASAEILDKVEIEEKKLMILELEEDIQKVQKKLEVQEEAYSCFRSELKAMTNKLKSSDAQVAALKDDVNRLSQQKEDMIGFLGELEDRMSKVSGEDTKLLRTLDSVVQSLDEKLVDSLKENIDGGCSLLPKKKMDIFLEERPPFRPVN